MSKTSRGYLQDVPRPRLFENTHIPVILLSGRREEPRNHAETVVLIANYEFGMISKVLKSASRDLAPLTLGNEVVARSLSTFH